MSSLEEEHIQKIQKQMYKLTLECLTNKKVSKEKVLVNKKEYKFYRNRIVDLTKQMLLSSETRNIMTNELRNEFNLYTNLCIEYFKIIDTTDFFQEEYNEMDANLNITTQNDICNDIGDDVNDNMHENMSLSELNALLMNIPLKEEEDEDNFNNNNNLKYEKKITTYPQTKQVDLFDKSLKNKRICRKKNNGIHYKEDKSNENEKEKTETKTETETEIAEEIKENEYPKKTTTTTTKIIDCSGFIGSV